MEEQPKDDSERSNERSPTETRRVVGAIRRDKGKVIATRKGCRVIADMTAAGWGRGAVAKALGVSAMTLRALVGRQPEVAQALAEGMAAVEYLHRSNLTELALQRDDLRTAAIASMFLLKSVCGYRDQGEARDTQQTVNVNVLTLPAASTPEQYAKLIEAGSGSPGANIKGTLTHDTREEETGPDDKS